MPTSILDVEINDEQFKSFLERFAKYQDAVKDMPGLWGEQGEVVGTVAVSFAAMTAELVAQVAALNKQTEAVKQRGKIEDDEAKRRRQNDKDQAERDKQAAGRRKQVIEDVRTLGRTIASGVADAAKWAAVGGGAALAGGALSFWGLDQFVAGVGQERRLASGFGVSTGERQALGVNFQRYFDVNSTLENVANAQADPSKWWAFSSMGLNRGGNPADVTTQAMLRARQMFIADGGNLALAQAQGLTEFFSPDDLRRLQHTPLAELQAGIKSSAEDQKRFALSDDVNQKWQNFIVKLDEAGFTLKNALVDKLTRLEPDLERIIGKFTQLAVTVLDRIDFNALGQGLDQFTQYIGSKQFQTDFKTVVDDIGYAANKLVGAMRLLGLLPDAPPPAGAAPMPGVTPGSPSMAQDPTGKGGFWTHDIFGNPKWHPPQNPLFDEVTAKVGQLTGGDISKGAKVASALQRDLGLGPGAAAGIVGNLLAEDPSLVAMNEKNPKRGRGGFGWAQWTGPRRVEFEQWAAAHKLDVHSDEANYGFLVYELRTKFKSLLKKIQNESVGAATADIYRVFEAPAAGDRSLAARVAKAVKVDVTIKNHAGTSVAASANAASAG